VAAYVVRQANSAVLQLQGFAGTGTSAASVESFLAAQNTALTSPAATVQTTGTGTIVNYTGGSCLTSVP